MYDKRFLNKKVEYPYQVISDKEDIEQIIKLYIQKYYNEEDDKITWFNKIKELAGELGYAKAIVENNLDEKQEEKKNDDLER